LPDYGYKLVVKHNIMKRIVYLAICAAISFASCKKESATVSPSDKDTTKTGSTTNPTTGGTTTVNTNIDNAGMLKLVNDTRTAGCTCGTTVMPPVAPLTWNDILASSALAHSEDMNATGQFSHNSSDGTSFSARITAAGYIWSTVGENIAWGQTTEQQVFTAWIQSEGHCKNIMNGAFKEFGAARAGTYWTQDFGTKR
jgi:uncharacterized protein YkwD